MNSDRNAVIAECLAAVKRVFDQPDDGRALDHIQDAFAELHESDPPPDQHDDIAADRAYARIKDDFKPGYIGDQKL